ncbi:unnamed protein product [Calicophoron daubneyi]|uniref:Uncharacterized protein n=1 Tax=Calicophoron daubneyi TaxID=300641 RepID=A0AAV2T7X7_CALDB
MSSSDRGQKSERNEIYLDLADSQVKLSSPPVGSRKRYSMSLDVLRDPKASVSYSHNIRPRANPVTRLPESLVSFGSDISSGSDTRNENLNPAATAAFERLSTLRNMTSSLIEDRPSAENLSMTREMAVRLLKEYVRSLKDFSTLLKIKEATPTRDAGTSPVHSPKPDSDVSGVLNAFADRQSISSPNFSSSGQFDRPIQSGFNPASLKISSDPLSGAGGRLLASPRSPVSGTSVLSPISSGPQSSSAMNISGAQLGLQNILGYEKSFQNEPRSGSSTPKAAQQPAADGQTLPFLSIRANLATPGYSFSEKRVQGSPAVNETVKSEAAFLRPYTHMLWPSEEDANTGPNKLHLTSLELRTSPLSEVNILTTGGKEGLLNVAQDTPPMIPQEKVTVDLTPDLRSTGQFMSDPLIEARRGSGGTLSPPAKSSAPIFRNKPPTKLEFQRILLPSPMPGAEDTIRSERFPQPWLSSDQRTQPIELPVTISPISSPVSNQPDIHKHVIQTVGRDAIPKKAVLEGKTVGTGRNVGTSSSELLSVLEHKRVSSQPPSVSMRARKDALNGTKEFLDSKFPSAGGPPKNVAPFTQRNTDYPITRRPRPLSLMLDDTVHSYGPSNEAYKSRLEKQDSYTQTDLSSSPSGTLVSDSEKSSPLASPGEPVLGGSIDLSKKPTSEIQTWPLSLQSVVKPTYDDKAISNPPLNEPSLDTVKISVSTQPSAQTSSANLPSTTPPTQTTKPLPNSAFTRPPTRHYSLRAPVLSLPRGSDTADPKVINTMRFSIPRGVRSTSNTPPIPSAATRGRNVHFSSDVLVAHAGSGPEPLVLSSAPLKDSASFDEGMAKRFDLTPKFSNSATKRPVIVNKNLL